MVVYYNLGYQPMAMVTLAIFIMFINLTLFLLILRVNYQ